MIKVNRNNRVCTILNNAVLSPWRGITNTTTKLKGEYCSLFTLQ